MCVCLCMCVCVCVCVCRHGILLRFKKTRKSCNNNMDEPGEHYAK